MRESGGGDEVISDVIITNQFHKLLYNNANDVD